MMTSDIKAHVIINAVVLFDSVLITTVVYLNAKKRSCRRIFLLLLRHGTLNVEPLSIHFLVYIGRQHLVGRVIDATCNHI